MFRTTLFRIHDMYMHALYNFNFHATEVCIHDMYTCTHCTCLVFENTQPTYCTTSTSIQLKFAISPNSLTTILVPWIILITSSLECKPFGIPLLKPFQHQFFTLHLLLLFRLDQIVRFTIVFCLHLIFVSVTSV